MNNSSTNTCSSGNTNIISSLFSVSGKNVLITGGSRGIGFMIAKTFVQAGANVLLTSRSEQACKEATESIIHQVGIVGVSGNNNNNNSNSNHNNNNHNNTPIPTPIPIIQYVASNVSNREGCEELAQYTAKVFDNKLDVLINNAGTSWGEPLERDSGKRTNWGFDKVLDLNIKGIFYLTRACIPMLENAASSSSSSSSSEKSDNDNDNNNDNTTNNNGQQPSRIINVGSIVGIIPQAAPTHAYDVSKAAVHQLTKKLAADLASKNITVNALAPGFVATRMSRGLQTWGATQDVLKKTIPLGRMGNEDDMAGACIYLCSKAGSYLTGVILNVDGGSIGAIQIDLGSNL